MAFNTTPGRDIVDGTNGNDTIYGRGGNDVIRGLGGDDNLYGNGGRDRLVGGAGHDSLYGGLGNDVLLGGNGLDLLVGGAGNDTLVGGAWSDSMVGGTGADRFVFTPDDVAYQDAWSNVIGDFSHADGDRIDVSTLNDAGGYTGTPLVFIGTDAFSGNGGEIRYTVVGSVTVVEVDVLNSGDWDYGGNGDFMIELIGVTGLTADDFIF